MGNSNYDIFAILESMPFQRVNSANFPFTKYPVSVQRLF